MPLVQNAIGDKDDLEFDAQPERLNIKTFNKQLSEKVVMLKTTPKYNEQLQTLLSSLYAETNTTDIGTLRKYAFVHMNLPVDINKEMAQGLLRSQQLFRQNVYYFICKNIFRYDVAFSVPTFNEEDEIVQENTTSDATKDEQRNAEK